MFGRETLSHFSDVASKMQDAADRVNGVGYDAQVALKALEPVRVATVDTLDALADAADEWKTAGQLVSIAVVVVTAALVIGIGIGAYREWDR